MNTAPSFSVDVHFERAGTCFAAAFAAPAGITALVGPSGAGKTTVLNLIAGLVRPTRGRIAVEGTVLFDSAQGLDLAPERRAAGYVFQDLRLFPHLNVRDNLRYGHRRAGARNWLTLDEAAEFLGLSLLLDRPPRTLSGGEAQRVAIGRALLSGPRFLLMDEPLTGLDADRRAEILPMIERIRDELGLPILYVSHDRAEVGRLADTVIDLG